MDATDAHEAARFSKSAAKLPELAPSDDMLRRHELMMALLPDRYGRSARVVKTLDTLCSIHRILARGAARARAQSEPLRNGHGWGVDGIFRPPG